MYWKRMKGIVEDFTCPKCHRVVQSDDYDEMEDLCHYCLFPEMAVGLPVLVDEFGNPTTPERQLLDNLDYTPEKQGKKAKESLNRYKNRKLYK